VASNGIVDIENLVKFDGLTQKLKKGERKSHRHRQHGDIISLVSLKLNSVDLVRKQTIPTERPPLVGEVSANFCGQKVSRGQHNGSPLPLISVF
jgi:hypothetical protein